MNMNIPLFISRFLYRIRYQLIFGSIIVTALVAYFTQFLPKQYTVKTTIYTGIVSSTTLSDDNIRVDYQSVNNTFDNMINLLKAQSTLENVSLSLFALNLIHGNPDEDNQYITARNYKDLNKMVPDEIKDLIDHKSVEKSVENLKKYLQATPDNFIYRLLNGWNPFYSYDALSKIEIRRAGNSDMINLSYTSTDPGITTNTVKLFNEALLNNYNELRYRATNDVIAYFEKEVERYRKILNKQEDALTQYNIANNIINYGEQTKAIAHSFANYEDRYEETLRRYKSSQQLLESLEKQMDTRTKLFLTNKDFLTTLDSISSINGRITEIETFTSDDALNKDEDLNAYRQQLRNTEKKIADISNSMNAYKYSKEGVGIQEMVTEWLNALIQNTKAKAELEVLNDRKADFFEKYTTYSPVGTEIKRREREISVTENSYLQMLHALNMAYLRKKNIQLTTSGLNTITDPSFPLNPNKSKRMLLVIAAFICSLLFIIGWNLIIELLDRTLRDGERASRLIGIPIYGAFSGRRQLRFRGYSKTWNRISAIHTINKLNQYLKPKEKAYFNILSIERKEGKSHIIYYLMRAWQKQGLRVQYIQAGRDFSPTSPAYLYAKDFSDIYPENKSTDFDILIIEYPDLQHGSVPPALLQKANINLLITNVCRVWKKSDEEIINHLKEMAGNTPVVIYLNNTNREAVEDFTGNLPPYTSQHSLATQMRHMGLTAREGEIKRR